MRLQYTISSSASISIELINSYFAKVSAKKAISEKLGISFDDPI
jgi:hypothetical protein